MRRLTATTMSVIVFLGAVSCAKGGSTSDDANIEVSCTEVTMRNTDAAEAFGYFNGLLMGEEEVLQGKSDFAPNIIRIRHKSRRLADDAAYKANPSVLAARTFTGPRCDDLWAGVARPRRS